MRTIRLLAYDNANLLDITGPAQVFASASQYAMRLGERDAPSYGVEIVSLAGGTVRTSADVVIETARALVSPVDTFLVAGGFGAESAQGEKALLDYIRAEAPMARRAGSVCTGAFVLAATGLLDGRRATTHWAWRDAFTAAFPKVSLEPDAVYVEDGKYWTSAGVLAGVDMAMAMVERDLGLKMADYTARALVAESRRARGEPQISARLDAQAIEGARIRRLMEWIANNPGEDLSAVALAGRACMSIRSLQRHFAAEARETPAAFVERTRVESARRLLVTSDAKLDAVAAQAGFTSLSAMQRAFLRVIGLPPSQYRQRMAAHS